jgi:AraC family transcriptional regulator of adaptative response / DNA-3-methyladenine glycosylase II
MLAFFRKRRVEHVEWVADATDAADAPALARTLRVQTGGASVTGWVRIDFDAARSQVLLRTSESLRVALPQVIRRVRALLDLDADPQAIHAVLQDRFPDGAGLRVPGTVDGFELAVRAVLGQQITVAAARTLAQRLVDRFGTAIDTPWPGLSRLFPTAAALAELGAGAGDALGQLGIVRQRQAAIVALARAVHSGALRIHAGADIASTVALLKSLPGIGDWTAQYIAMRALRWPDAFPAGDVALHKALGVLGDKQAARAAEAASLAWQPWRSYAVLRAWAELPAPISATRRAQPRRTAPPTTTIDNQNS